MDNKKLGIILLIIGIALLGITLAMKSNNDAMLEKIIVEKGSCFLDDGTCLHADRDLTLYIITWIFSLDIQHGIGIKGGFCDHAAQMDGGAES